MINQFYFKQFNLALDIGLHTVQISNSSISPIDRTLSCATTSDQSEPGSNDNERVVHNPQSSMTYASLSDSLVSYPGYSLVRGGPNSLQKCIRCILQPQPTGLAITVY